MYALGALCVLFTLWAAAPLLLQTGKSSDLAANSRFKTILVYAFVPQSWALYPLLLSLLAGGAQSVCNLACVEIVGLVARVASLAGRRLARLAPLAPHFSAPGHTPPVPGWREPWQSRLDVAKAMSEGTRLACWSPIRLPYPSPGLGLLVPSSWLWPFLSTRNFETEDHMACAGYGAAGAVWSWSAYLAHPSIMCAISPPMRRLCALARRAALDLQVCTRSLCSLGLTVNFVSLLHQMWTIPPYEPTIIAAPWQPLHNSGALAM